MAGETVLVVDDERATREGWQRALRLAGYNCFAAAGAREALALCDEHTFDAVVLDFMMPEMDGITLLGRIRRKQPLTRSILVSGKLGLAADEQEISRHAREAVEVDIYLNKPVSNDRLKDEIGKLVAGVPPADWKTVAETVVREEKRGAKAGRELARTLKTLAKKKR